MEIMEDGLSDFCYIIEKDGEYLPRFFKLEEGDHVIVYFWKEEDGFIDYKIKNDDAFIMYEIMNIIEKL